MIVIHIPAEIVLETAQQNNTAGAFIAKTGNRTVYSLLQIAETDDIAKRLDGVQDTVRAGKCLDKAVHFEVFVHPQRVQGRSVKAGQEHIDNDQ